MSDIKVGDRVSHSGEPGAYGTVEEVDHSCFGTCVLVRYDDGKTGYHRESRLVLEDCMHSKKTSVDGCIKEATRSPFGNTATTVYDELAVGYHLHLAAFGANRKLVK